MNHQVELQCLPSAAFPVFPPGSPSEPHRETCRRDRLATVHRPDASQSSWPPGNAPDAAWHYQCLVTK